MSGEYSMKRLLLKWYLKVRFGEITSKVVGTAGDNIPAEIEYYGRGGKVVGFWAYGYYRPKYPYQGQDEEV